MKHARFILTRLKAALADTPVVLLNGPRQAGKSTLMQYLARSLEDTTYITLDEVTALAAAKRDPQGFIASFSGRVIIDEVQRAPELFLAIKRAVDLERTPGKFLLTGSANVLLLPNIADSLAGRMEILPLHPLSVSEISGQRENLIDSLFEDKTLGLKSFRQSARNWNGIQDYLLSGGFPEALERTAEDRRRAWFEAYITTILSRDVRDLAAIEGLSRLPDLLNLLASRSGTLLNYSELSRSVGLPMTTLKRYFRLLETLFLVHTVPAWSRNLGKRLVKSPKIFMADTGLLSHLTGIRKGSLEANGMLLGRILETFVVNECAKANSWSQTGAKLYQYRTTAGSEVDCVLEAPGGRVVGIEVKAASSVTRRDIQGLISLAEACGSAFVRGVVVYRGNELIPLGEKLVALPISC